MQLAKTNLVVLLSGGVWMYEDEEIGALSSLSRIASIGVSRCYLLTSVMLGTG